MCVFAAFIVGMWGVYLYLLDEDVTLIDVKTFNTEKNSIYPSVSLFLYSPCTKEKLEKHEKGITPAIYQKFLQGD